MSNKPALNTCYVNSTGNSAQCYAAAWLGAECGRGWIHVCARLSPFAVHLKLLQHCLSAVPQWKTKS